MRITGYLHNCPPYRLVGGEMMTLRLLQHSASQGHDVRAVVRELDHERMFEDVRLIAGHTSTNQGALEAFNQADVIVTHPEISDGPYRYSTRYTRTPTIGIIHNLGPKNLRGIRQRPNMTIVANSYETARLLSEMGAARAQDLTVIHPPTYPPQPPVAGLPRAFCTQVNLSQAKGAQTLRRLVRDLPEVQFLAVLGGHGAQEVPKNVNNNMTLYGHVSGLGLPLGMTRVLLAPSRDETYGMVVCEATALGIPVVASSIPAHHEALGDSPTYVEIEDSQGWHDAIKLLMTDDSAWQEAHARAVAHGIVLQRREAESYATWDRLIQRVAT